ncbi:hypothetical protein llap_4001 [Limosa lapponica baueri]|uniref:Uncharacterized protein n=1 Tax=Limosa lapponica baueri TaxID=1758121 RepID=A0A2I0UI30_LIMLA|nr:hypothetical protein llap_4001 [Limosa lapponica baueri]
MDEPETLLLMRWVSPLMDLQGLPLAEKVLMVWAQGKVYEIITVPAFQSGNVGKHLGPSDETTDWGIGLQCLSIDLPG